MIGKKKEYKKLLKFVFLVFKTPSDPFYTHDLCADRVN